MYSIENQTRALRKTHINLVVVGGWNMAHRWEVHKVRLTTSMTAHIDERSASSTLGLIQLAQEAFERAGWPAILGVWVDAGFA